MPAGYTERRIFFINRNNCPRIFYIENTFPAAIYITSLQLLWCPAAKTEICCAWFHPSIDPSIGALCFKLCADQTGKEGGLSFFLIQPADLVELPRTRPYNTYRCQIRVLRLVTAVSKNSGVIPLLLEFLNTACAHDTNTHLIILVFNHRSESPIVVMHAWGSD